MTMPWSEQQRQALRAFRAAISDRARREADIAGEEQARQRDTEAHFAREKDRVEVQHANAQAGASSHAEHARQRLREQQQKRLADIEREHGLARDQYIADYNATKNKMEAEFREARWTTTTVYDADKRVAKEQMVEAITSCKELMRKLLAHWRQGRELIENLEFLDDIPPLDPKEISVDGEDPWQRMLECADQAALDLRALQTMKSPRIINGYLPWLILAAALLTLAAPGLIFYFLLDQPREWLYTSAAAAIVLPIGYWIINRMRRQTNDRIIALWLSLRHNAHLARQLRPIRLKMAKKAYLTKKRNSYRHNRQLLRDIVAKAKVKLTELRARRDQALKKISAAYKKRLARHHADVETENRAVEETLARAQQQASDQYAVDIRLVESAHVQQRDDNHHWHTQIWTELLRDWKSACDAFTSACRNVARDAEQWFPSWSKPLELPKALPHGLPIGSMQWTLDMFPQGVPKDSQLPRPDLTKSTYPALVPFPRAASLLYRARDEGKSAAIEAMSALLLRCWTSMPAGKVRCTIIDAIGRGENFSAFMHLADHDEKLVDGRIWTETLQIDERLTNLTVHMENVLQKYLRNQFQTLAEYNEQAGEVAEPFHFLVVAHFPVNFSEDAARRLVSLASAGARCGIYTLVMVDTKQPMPHGFNLSDLEKVCTILHWQPSGHPSPSGRGVGGEGGFAWEDEDFGNFPLALEKPPSPDRCTELLRRVGEEAVRASKVEVPFEWIMPARDEWWKSDSANGIRVPIGRFGAQGKQYLELGQGTSQHVLVAGKTGSGKSTLLHVLITQLAMFYSPREVELYLIDFKKGVEFKAYASLSLPHARVVAVESEREFGLSVLQRLDLELSKRGEIYRTAGVNDLASYREYAEKRPELPHLPRVLLIVDEFQEFFIEDDKLAQEASLLMDRLVRQGRAFGIHVLLGSQTIGGAYSLARSTIDQM
ncbi:MAG TPA: FtsK/SpoIIIE domain-containing protein, partial [Gemmataceae bacterium]|nr:FtsK/SpoIIIE domain-containing protein [Gemmataceae bacterium]